MFRTKERRANGTSALCGESSSAFERNKVRIDNQWKEKVMQSWRCLIFVFVWISSPVWAKGIEPLRVQGKDIVDSKGQVASMRGINFGGWLMMETWIPSIEMEWHDHLPRLAKEAGTEKELHRAMEDIGEFDDDTEKVLDYISRLHSRFRTLVEKDKFEAYMGKFRREPSVFAAKEMDEVLRRRFGDYGAGEIWNAFHDIWITETDFQLAKAMGFNFVRVPFWYRWFENDDAPYEYSEYGFRYLDKTIAWAKEHGLYVMLDLHGAVGGQSPWDHTGELSRGEFILETISKLGMEHFSLHEQYGRILQECLAQPVHSAGE